ncbi:hypothetical protein AAFN88_18290 [Pelagibius sp. CAU 1746]|uniref:P-loop ATPase, Sll1717 family n=1 Tax=Pelagibius sp. CAU 1746 TaxID=3140370 RepID=UPI00325B3164
MAKLPQGFVVLRGGMTKRPTHPNIVFRRTWKIGAPDAESDERFLSTCFVDTGALEELRDCQEPRRIVVGRTGIGKTALLKQLQKSEENVIELQPEVLSLNHLSNSNIIKFLEEIDVHLDLFYKVLWDHVLAVELIRRKFDIRSEPTMNNFFDNILPNFSKKSMAREKAIAYLREWGDKFWTETEYRVKEFTTKLENDVKAAVGGQLSGVSFGVDAAKSLTSEQKGEIVRRAQEVVQKIQIKDLHSVISLLADSVFTDPQQRYYIVIDRLDEDWVDDSIRYKLIKALIEAVRNFQSIRHVKVVVAIRTDLLQRVLRKTMSSGFQDEKYEALYLKLRWTEQELEQVLDRRINEIFKSKYTSGGICFRDIMPKNQMEKTDSLGYIFKRTSRRPREVIMYINECIEKAEGRSRFTADIIRSAEVTYSQKRVTSLEQEWGSDYPSLRNYIRVLKGKASHFSYNAISEEEILNSIAQSLQQGDMFEDDLCVLGRKYISSTVAGDEVKDCWFTIMYRIGVVGIKPMPNIIVQWSFIDDAEIPDGYELQGMEFYVHPAYWIGLGISLK